MIRLTAILLLFAPLVQADPLRVAVAANFLTTAEQIAEAFEGTEGEVQLISGSTGALYLQITQGAPFDVFLSADSLRPERLVEQGIGSDLQVYALGRLALIAANGQPEPEMLTRTGLRVTLANPETAPYGQAAMEVLGHLSSAQQHILVKGNSVAQAFAFVASGNADLGLVAYAQVLTQGRPHWQVPQEMHSPIVQAAVRLSDHEQVESFMIFLASETTRRIISAAGYEVPE